MSENISSTPLEEKSLYERIGGKKAVKKAVDVFYSKVLADPKLTNLFANTDMEGLMQHQYSFMVSIFGGPDIYKGRALREAHRNKGITEEHFDAVANHLHDTLKEIGVTNGLIGEVMTLVASTREEVLDL